MSFVDMTQYLLQQPGVDFILSAKLNQDPLEEFFGKQRAIGRRADNPTVKQFLDNTATLHVVKTAGVSITKGNVKRQLPFSDDLLTPLPKRRRT